MIGKPEWFTPKKFGWGLGIRRPEGIAYVIVVALFYGAIFVSPLGNGLKAAAAVVLSALIIADILHIMYSVYSHLDEREEKHQLVAERNASFTAVALITVYVVYVISLAALTKSIQSLDALVLPIALLVAMSLAKGGTFLLLEREG